MSRIRSSTAQRQLRHVTREDEVGAGMESRGASRPFGAWRTVAPVRSSRVRRGYGCRRRRPRRESGAHSYHSHDHGHPILVRQIETLSVAPFSLSTGSVQSASSSFSLRLPPADSAHRMGEGQNPTIVLLEPASRPACGSSGASPALFPSCDLCVASTARARRLASSITGRPSMKPFRRSHSSAHRVGLSSRRTPIIKVLRSVRSGPPCVRLQ